MTEVYATLNKTVTEEEVNEAMKAAQRPSFEYNTDEIVSSDIIGNPAGSVFDATQTKVIDGENGQVVKVVAWYDNEYGFTGNMVRTLERLATV